MSLPNLTESKEKELRVVAIGGGTGLSTLLRGLKRYVVDAGPEERDTDWGRTGAAGSCSGSLPFAAVRCAGAFCGGDGDRRWRFVGAPARRPEDAAAGRHPELHGGAVRG